MRNSLLWLAWLVLPVFVLTFHYGPGQIWLARDQAATSIRQAEAESTAATKAQEAAYQLQLKLVDARRSAFVAGIDWKTQSKHPLAQSVLKAKSEQDAAYGHAADVWHRTAKQYGEATETLLKAIGKASAKDAELLDADQDLLESLRWAEARALVRSGEVFNGIQQLQALLDLRTAETHQRASSIAQLTSTANRKQSGASDVHDLKALPTNAIREELAAAQYVGARLLREEGRPSEVWRPVSNAARQHYRYLSGTEAGTEDSTGTKTLSDDPAEQNASVGNQTSTQHVDRKQRTQRNLEQVLNLEQIESDQLEGVPLPRNAPLARRPGDGQPGNGPGKGAGRGPLRDGPPNNGAGVPEPWGEGW